MRSIDCYPLHAELYHNVFPAPRITTAYVPLLYICMYVYMYNTCTSTCTYHTKDTKQYKIHMTCITTYVVTIRIHIFMRIHKSYNIAPQNRPLASPLGPQAVSQLPTKRSETRAHARGYVRRLPSPGGVAAGHGGVCVQYYVRRTYI